MKKSLRVGMAATFLGISSAALLLAPSAPVQANITLDSGGLCTIDTGQESDSFMCFYDYGTGSGMSYMTFYRADGGGGTLDESDRFGTFLTRMSTEPHVRTFIWPDGTEEPIRGYSRDQETSAFTFWLERGWAVTFQYPD